MNKYINDLKDIVDDDMITPSERYNKLIRYINQIYDYENKDVRTEEEKNDL